MEVTDAIEQVYYEGTGPKRPHFISGGSPCQCVSFLLWPLHSFPSLTCRLFGRYTGRGFSTLNRYKRADDLRILEPFVYLGALAVHRPVSALHENVANFLKFSLPTAQFGGKGTFCQLWMAVALSLRYQLRWNVDNAAS